MRCEGGYQMESVYGNSAALKPCMLLSMVDRLSGDQDLIEQLAPEIEGFGKYHPPLR